MNVTRTAKRERERERNVFNSKEEAEKKERGKEGVRYGKTGLLTEVLIQLACSVF